MYTMDAAQREATQTQIDQWTADCLATIDRSASEYDQALGVYTYLINTRTTRWWTVTPS